MYRIFYYLSAQTRSRTLIAQRSTGDRRRPGGPAAELDQEHCARPPWISAGATARPQMRRPL